MQEQPSGIKAPRKEGMEFFYDNLLPKKVVPALLKKLDKSAKVTITKLAGVDDRSGTGAEQLAWQVQLSDELKSKISEGFSLFQQEQGLAKGSFEVDGDKAIIRLAKIKDESTFFHEMGHHFMEAMRRVATVPGAPRQIMEDYAIILDQLGENGKMTREAEEKFADAFLVYMYEGKTPNKKLQGVFDRFRAWVISTLRWLTSQEFADAKGTKLSPELRGVFDRLLATDEEINAAKMTSGFVGIQDQGADLSIAQLSRLQELQRQAHALAFAQILSGQIRDLEAEGTEKYAATEAEQRRQAKEQLEALPAFKAGKQIVKQLKSKQGAVQVMRDYLLGKKEKHWQTFETIAEVNGYPSADKMAEDIITSKDLDEAIEDEVKSRMSFDYHRKLIDREAIREKAQDLLHNERTLEILALEQEFLNELLSDVDAQQQAQQEQTAEKKAKAAKKKESRADRAKVRAALRKGQLEYVRSRAKEIVAKLSTSRVAKLGPFYTVERRTAQALGKAIAQKKFEEAAKLKGQQMLNHAVASEAAKAKARVTKGLAQLEKIRKKDRDAFKKQEHFDQAAALLARMGFNHPAYSPEARQETLAEWAKRMEESTNAVAIEGWLLDETLPLDPKAMSVEKFQQALDAVKNIIRVANLEDRALTLMGKIDMNELLTKLEVAQVEGRKGRKTRVHRMQENRIQKWVEKARLFGLSNIRVQNLAQSIQGFEENGPWT